MLACFLSTLARSKKGIIRIQTVNQGLSLMAGVVLKGYSGVMQDAVGMARNLYILCLADKFSGKKSRTVISILFIAAGAVLGIAFNNRGVLGLLPVAASIQHSFFIVYPKTTDKHIRLATFISTTCWAVYSLPLYNYVGAAANAAIAVSALWQLMRGKKEHT